MSDFVKVAKVSEIPDGGVKCIEVGGHRIGVYNLGGTFYAIDDTCTHADASLCEGPVADGEVACPLHGATFDIRTGAVTGPPAYEDVATYEVRTDGDEIEVRLGGT